MLHAEHVELDELGGGRFRQTISLKPIAYRKDGSLRRIGNALTTTGSADFPLAVDELCQFRIDPRIAGKSPLIHFGKGQSMVRFALSGANNVAGQVSGNSVTFPNAWNNADLEYVIGGHRLYEYIHLRANHPRTFTFIIQEHVGFDPKTLQFGNDFRILQPTLEPPMGSEKMALPLSWIVSQQGGKWQLSVTLPVGDWTGWALDPTLTLQPNAADGIDTMIMNGGATNNCGGHSSLYIGEETGSTNWIDRTLIRFNLISIPSDAIITSSVLSLYAWSDYSSNARTCRVYRQKRAWLEGTRVFADDAPATGATWIRYDTTNNWQTAGGFGANDCEQADIGSRDFTATETLNEFKNFVLTPTTKAGLDLGNGWMVKMDTETNDAYGFASSDHATAAWHPKLVVGYTLPGGAIFNPPFAAPFKGIFG